MENRVKFFFQARVFIRGMGVGSKCKISAQYFQNKIFTVILILI